MSDEMATLEDARSQRSSSSPCSATARRVTLTATPSRCSVASFSSVRLCRAAAATISPAGVDAVCREGITYVKGGDRGARNGASADARGGGSAGRRPRTLVAVVPTAGIGARLLRIGGDVCRRSWRRLLGIAGRRPRMLMAAVLTAVVAHHGGSGHASC